MLKKIPKKISVHITSLGCPKNLVDTEIMAASLLKKSLQISNTPSSANVLLINSCAFIKPARDESSEHIRRALLWKGNNHGRKVVLCGCLNQFKGDNQRDELVSKVDLRLGLNDIETAAEKIESLFTGLTTQIETKIQTPVFLPNASTPRLQLSPPHYAYLKIADGCSNHCSYCSIPSIRGKFRSRKPDDITTEASNLLRNGCRELILIAQDSSNYGRDIDKKNNIVDLLRKLENLKSAHNYWVRLMYCHPKHFSDGLLEIFENSSSVLPYLDLPLQHISDKILKAMNRGSDSNKSKKIIEKIKSLKRKIAIRTTFICGFPGESEDDFNELFDFVKDVRFDRLGVFAYSPEPNTKAVSLPGKVPLEIAEKRRKILLELQQKISLSNNKKLLGSKLDTILDKCLPNKKYLGRTIYDAPNIDNTVEIKSVKDLQPGTILKTKIVSASEYSLGAVYLTF